MHQNSEKKENLLKILKQLRGVLNTTQNPERRNSAAREIRKVKLELKELGEENTSFTGDSTSFSSPTKNNDMNNITENDSSEQPVKVLRNFPTKVF